MKNLRNGPDNWVLTVCKRTLASPHTAQKNKFKSQRDSSKLGKNLTLSPSKEAKKPKKLKREGYICTTPTTIPTAFIVGILIALVNVRSLLKKVKWDKIQLCLQQLQEILSASRNVAWPVPKTMLYLKNADHTVTSYGWDQMTKDQWDWLFC